MCETLNFSKDNTEETNASDTQNTSSSSEDCPDTNFYSTD